MVNILDKCNYIKLSALFYMKPIKNGELIGDYIFVDLYRNKIDLLSVKDKFLCFSCKPKIIKKEYKFFTFSEFKRLVARNETAINEFIDKYIDWENKHESL